MFRIDSRGDMGLSTLLLRLLVNALGIWLAAFLVPGIVVGDWQSLVAGTAIFALVNALLKPLALLVSCCLVAVTFGLFVFVINALLLVLTAWVAGELGLNFEVDGFIPAFLGALIISVVSLLASIFVRAPR